MSESVFIEKLAPEYTDKGMTVEDVAIAQSKLGTHSVATVSFTTTLDGVVSYVTKFYVQVSEETIVTVTVTEVAQRVGVASVVNATINIK